MDQEDIAYLERAMELAELARGDTSPNPIVGAVIVRDGNTLGEGYHRGPGQDHGEVAAIKDALDRAGRATAGEFLRGSTIYVSLEPCCTYGRTPPCTEALVAAGFGRVVVGAIDPSPRVNGKGLKRLREAGMQVDLAEGASAHRAMRQNDGMRKAAITGLPFVTYKYAMTLDGRVATDAGDSRWVSGPESRALVHQWRAWSDAVVVGSGTVKADDPQLTARDVPARRQPLRVVVGQNLELGKESALVRTVGAGPVLAVCGPDTPAARRAEMESWGVETLTVPLGPEGRLDPVEIGRALVGRGVVSVLLEGGPRLAGGWWTARLVDKVAAFINLRVAPGVQSRGPLVATGPGFMGDAAPLREVTVARLGGDVLVVGYREEPY